MPICKGLYAAVASHVPCVEEDCAAMLNDVKIQNSSVPQEQSCDGAVWG